MGNVELIALTGSLFHAQTNGLSHIIEELLPKCEDDPFSVNGNISMATSRNVCREAGGIFRLGISYVGLLAMRSSNWRAGGVAMYFIAMRAHSIGVVFYPVHFKHCPGSMM